MRTCKKCERELADCHFQKEPKVASGLKARCRDCVNAREKARRASITPVIPNFKVCGWCLAEFSSDMFFRDNSKKDGLAGKCKDCMRRCTPDRERRIPERYELDALTRVLGLPVSTGKSHPEVSNGSLGLRLGATADVVNHWRARGLSWWQADEVACRAGYHPALIWPEWSDARVGRDL